MKFGVREICDVVLKAKYPVTIGSKKFYKNEPVIYFDSLKTSSMEGAATTVYAQGGKGNSRLIAWEGERTVTFTMEDALISPLGFMILSGAGLIEASEDAIVTHDYNVKVVVDDNNEIESVELPAGAKSVAGTVTNKPTVTVTVAKGEDNKYSITASNAVAGDEIVIAYQIDEEVKGKEIAVHTTEQIKMETDTLYVSEKPYIDASGDYIYVMVLNNNGEIVTEPYIYTYDGAEKTANGYALTIKQSNYKADDKEPKSGSLVLVDYYMSKRSGTKQIEITADSFGGNYYLEASTLFRNTTGEDLPAEFIIPNCKIQSNFNFTMASSGDPSTFTFTMDAFPDYTRFDQTKKVLAAIQIIEDSETDEDTVRIKTAH